MNNTRHEVTISTLLVSPRTGCYAIYETLTPESVDGEQQTVFLTHCYGYENAIAIVKALKSRADSISYPPFQPDEDEKTPDGERYRVRPHKTDFVLKRDPANGGHYLAKEANT